MEQEDARAAAELRRLDAETRKLTAEEKKLDEESRKLRNGIVMDAAKLGLAVFAAVVAAINLMGSLGWL